MEGGRTMRAIPFFNACKAEELKVVSDWMMPKIEKETEVLIEVKAFGINFADIIARKGQYQDAPKFPFVPGYEVAGIIVEVGPKVQKYKPGQRVFALTSFGGYAEYAVSLEEAVSPLPDSWSFEQGAAVGVTFVTAYHSIFHTGLVLPGSKILIHACAGGVGLAALQLAKHAQLEIFGTCGSDEKVALLKEKGVAHAINYSKSDFEQEVKRITNGEGVDIVIDSLGGSNLKKDLAILRRNGRVIGIGAASFIDRSLWNTISLIPGLISMVSLSAIDMMINSKGFYGVNLKQLSMHRPQVITKALEELLQLFDQGIIKPEVSLQFSWEEVGRAHQMIENRKTTGKVVLTVSPKKIPHDAGVDR